ncbi:MAG TPA: DUF1638 domain-containing protein [Acidimicrobiia bacterium]|jgi:hypothetical protein
MAVALFDQEATFAPELEAEILVIACGAIARELIELRRLNGWDHLIIECLPAKLHNTPGLITDAVRQRLDRAEGRYQRVFVGYADCGTGGDLDRLLAERGIERIPGAHCYQFFAGGAEFLAMHDAEPATFYLTDFLCRHFDLFVVRGLGLDRHPELLPQYFGNYLRLVFLAQTDDPELDRRGQEAAAYLGLGYERVATGMGDLETSLARFAGANDG